MPWLQITLEAPQHLAETCSEILMEAGALSVTLEDGQENPLFEPLPGETPLWNSNRITGLFLEETPLQALRALLEPQFPLDIFNTFSASLLPDQDWTRTWMDSFQPMQFGDRLWICPSHLQVSDPNALSVLLDPGMAFGTGTHPTTRLCLQWLDQYSPVNQQVLDYGCGSGILGIAALKLGATFVSAVDYDPQALLSTEDNANKNGYTEKQIKALLPQDFKASTKVDLILANILANPLIALSSTFSEYLRPQGQLVLSGILENQMRALQEAYNPWFKVEETVLEEGWARMTFTRR